MKTGRSFKAGHFSLTLAVLVAVLLPLGYLALGYQKLAIILQTEAEANALYASQIINANPDYWLFEHVRLQEFLTHQSVATDRESRRITNLKGNTVAWNQIEVSYPVMIRSQYLYESGNLAGMLEITRSLRPLLGETLLVGAIGCLLMAAIYFPLKKYVIDAREQAEKALQESEGRYRLLVSNIPAIVYKGYWNWEIEFFDDKIEEFTGFSKEEFNERRLKWKDVIAEEDLENIRGIFIEALKTNKSYVREYRVRTKQNKVVWIQERSQILCHPDGRVDYISGVLFDITQRRQAEEDLKAQFLFLETLIDTIPNPIFYKDPEGKYLGCNRAFEKHFGVTREEIVGKTVYDLAQPELADTYHEIDQELLRRPGEQEYEARVRYADGSSHEAIFYKAPFHKADGSVGGLVGIMLDITQRKQVEETLREVQSQQRAILDNIPDIAWLKDRESRYIAANEPFALSCGFSREELVGKTDFDFWPLELAIRYRQDDAAVMRTGQPKLLEEPFVGADGKTVWIETIKTPVYNDQGEVIGTTGIAREFTARKQAADELRRAHQEIEQLFESIPFMMIGMSPDGRISHWNHEAAKTLWVKGTPVTGEKLQTYSLSWEWDKVLQGLGSCQEKGAPVRVEDIRYQRPDGKDGLLGITLSPITEEDGRIRGLILLGQDITEQRLLEAQLAQAQKLESIGQLAAGIAHEINTPIQYVGDNTRFLGDAFKDLLHLQEEYQSLLAVVRTGTVADDLLNRVETAAREIDLDYLMGEIPVAIGQSLEGVERVAKIVRAMKDFSHPGTAEKQAVNINKAIENTITVARNEWKYVAEIVTDFDPSLPPVPCHPDEFNQVILNIIINAAHAIGEAVGREPAEKGTITIKTRSNEDGVEISLSDTGGGIPEEIRSKIFDPFFTTKEVGRGTGQGLAISHAVIVDKHGGAINFESVLGQGTTFNIRLPLKADKPEKG